MNIFEKMDAYKGKYTKKELLIYEYVKKMPNRFANGTTTSCESLGFSQSSMTRFAKKLGFNGYAEFQYALKNDIATAKKQPKKQTRSEFYGNFLQLTEDAIDPKDLHVIASHIANAYRVVYGGNSLSNVPAHFLDQASKITSNIATMAFSAGDVIWNLDQRDVLLIFSSYSGVGFKNYLNYEGKNKPYTILVTLTNKHPLRHSFDKVVVLPESKSTDHGRNVLTETFAYMMFIDLLVEEIGNIGEKRKEDKEEKKRRAK